VIIEGHTDERGTGAYNLALGDRRAQRVLAYFRELGIDEKRLMTVSFGEERPVDPAPTEQAWSQNRRAHTAIE
jgi:peptidoglycan-associated lipoprotein